MAYKRRPTKKYTKKRKTNYMNYVKNTNTVAQTAYNALKLGKYVYSMINVEKKLHELSLASTACSSSGFIYPLCCNNASYPANAITQGDGYSQRNGASIKPKTLQIKGTIWTDATLAAGTRVRFIIFQDKHCNNQTVFPTSYLDAASVTAFKNYSNRFHYKTLYDRTFQLNANSNEIAGINIFKKLYGHITYTEDSDLCETSAYYVLVISDSNSAANISFRSRMLYIDN